MAKVKLILDTRLKSKSTVTGLFPIVLRVFHKKTRYISLSYQTLPDGWDSIKMKLKKSASVNKEINVDNINNELSDKDYSAKIVIREIGEKALELTDVDNLVKLIKDSWEADNDSAIKQRIINGITLSEWGDVLIKRKQKANIPSSGSWYNDGINAFIDFNKGKGIFLYDIDVTFLKDFQAHHESKSNSKNTISSYMRAIRAIYNSAIREKRFKTSDNPFDNYKIPSTSRTKKRAIKKEDLIKIFRADYPQGSPLWHAKNYAFIMFHCRGMNFVDLVKLKVKHIYDGRISYGRSKTGEPLSVGMTHKLKEIISYYTAEKTYDDFLFPTNNDGSTESFEKYKSQRRRMNKYLKIIAKDASIEGIFTTYTIRHSWATIAKYMGISTEIISEGLGHNSLRTTEIYLKSFTNAVLDEANELVVG